GQQRKQDPLVEAIRHRRSQSYGQWNRPYDRSHMERVNPGDAGSIFEPAGAGSGPVGGVAIVTQSASLAALFSDEIRTRAWRAAKVANIGNQLDVTHAQLIDWLRRDDETRVIGVHLEAVTDGQRLMAAISGVGKPV